MPSTAQLPKIHCCCKVHWDITVLEQVQQFSFPKLVWLLDGNDRTSRDGWWICDTASSDHHGFSKPGEHRLSTVQFVNLLNLVQTWSSGPGPGIAQTCKQVEVWKLDLGEPAWFWTQVGIPTPTSTYTCNTVGFPCKKSSFWSCWIWKPHSTHTTTNPYPQPSGLSLQNKPSSS